MLRPITKRIRWHLQFFLYAWLMAAITGFARGGESSPCEVAVYLWPNFHVDPRNEAALGKGWTEWNLVKGAVPHFAGHEQPKVPLWGYGDESDPVEMERQIQAMTDHGITAVIFDWYRYDDGPFLEDALRKGFLQARNRNSVKFALMWANHDYVDIFPASPGKHRQLMHPGPVTRKTFEEATDTIIKDYFSQPNYWKINGAPYFSIYELDTLQRGLGGPDALRDALDNFRRKTKAAGYPDLNLNVIDTGLERLSRKEAQPASGSTIEKTGQVSAGASPEASALAASLGVTSVTSYCWIHHTGINEPTEPYAKWAAKAEAKWPELQKEFSPFPFYPNVSMGWDSSPRTNPKEKWDPSLGYPYTGIITQNTPEEFKAALLAAKAYLDQRPAADRILTINAWNEWTEGSYLLPDKEHGMAYLDAVRDVFGAEAAH
jgi:hypothetical protein